MTQAEELTNNYQSMNPNSTSFELKVYFLEQMQEISTQYGGTVSISAPLGWGGQLQAHQSYFLSDSLECD